MARASRTARPGVGPERRAGPTRVFDGGRGRAAPRRSARTASSLATGGRTRLSLWTCAAGAVGPGRGARAHASDQQPADSAPMGRCWHSGDTGTVDLVVRRQQRAGRTPTLKMTLVGLPNAGGVRTRRALQVRGELAGELWQWSACAGSTWRVDGYLRRPRSGCFRTPEGALLADQTVRARFQHGR